MVGYVKEGCEVEAYPGDVEGCRQTTVYRRSYLKLTKHGQHTALCQERTEGVVVTGGNVYVETTRVSVGPGWDNHGT